MWIVTSWHDYPAALTGRTERALLDWFARNVRPGETWIDVGAHYGYTTFALAKHVGPTGRVFTFEPVVATAGCIDQGRVLNGLSQITVVPFGLGAADSLEIRRLGTTRGMADSTLAPDGPQSLAVVPLARLDWLWPLLNRNDGTIHGIKIDVQGMELETLAGMRDVVRRWRPRIVVELHAGVSRERVLELFRELGYSTDAVAIERGIGEPSTVLADNESYAFHPA